MKIGYVVFGQNSLNYGLAYCLFKSGVQAEPVTERLARFYDVILFSIFWWQHVYDFVDFCNKAGIGKHTTSRTRVVVGGFNSFNPVIFKKYAHAVVVGDGEDVILDAINEQSNGSIYTGIEKEVVYSQSDISENSFIYTNEAKICRMEIARGCPYHCKFCQLSALKKYREVSIETIDRSLSKIKEKRVALFAPNKTSHSKFAEIAKLLKKSGKIDLVPDVRFNDVEKFYSNNQLQIGIEGLTQKLRFSVGKALTDDRLREIVSFVIKRGIDKGIKPSISCGFILDLPAEQEGDFSELSQFLDGLNDLPNIDKFNMFFIFNLFMPSPFTPLENEPIHYQRNYQEKLDKVLKYDRKFAVAVHGRLFSNFNRVLSMIATRGGEDTIDIINHIKTEPSIKNGHSKLADSQKLPALEYILRSHGGIDRFVGVPKEKPWQIVKVK
jgi:radical SAM superfamily enzyme YgiQ (UPF0313 family)